MLGNPTFCDSRKANLYIVKMMILSVANAVNPKLRVA